VKDCGGQTEKSRRADREKQGCGSLSFSVYVYLSACLLSLSLHLFLITRHRQANTDCGIEQYGKTKARGKTNRRY
jgi:hypothetical protein